MDAIIINGVVHELRPDTGKKNGCNECSLKRICKSNFLNIDKTDSINICTSIFGMDTHRFQLKK